MSALVIPLHMGALHPMESLVMAGLSLGPFLILAVVVTLVSRRDRREDARRQAARQAARAGIAGQATRVDPARLDPTRSATTETAAPQSVQQ